MASPLRHQPGRWPPHERYPSSEHWKDAARHFLDFAKKHGSAGLLLKLTLGKVEAPTFEPEAVAKLKHRVVTGLSEQGYSMRSTTQDRTDLPIDQRFLELLLEASGCLGQFARGVRVGPGVRPGDQDVGRGGEEEVSKPCCGITRCDPQGQAKWNDYGQGPLRWDQWYINRRTRIRDQERSPIAADIKRLLREKSTGRHNCGPALPTHCGS